MVIAATTAVVSHALARSTYPILLPAIEDELLADHSQSGALTTINFGAYLGGVALVTGVSGRVEPARLLAVGTGLATAGFLLLADADGFGQLAAGQALTGLGGSAVWMSAPVLATGAVTPERRGTAMGALSSAMGLGIIAASQGTRMWRSVEGDDSLWRPTWLGAAAFSALVLLLVVGVLRTPGTAAISGGISLARLREVPGWRPLSLAYWLSGLVISSFTAFLGAALEEDGLSREHVANLYSLFGLATACGALTLGRLSDRIGRRPVLQATLAGTGLASLLVLTGREPWATLAAVLFGASAFTYPVLIAAHLSDHLQGRAFANAFGALTLIYGSALTAGPYVAGAVGDGFGFDPAFGGLAALAGAGTVVISRLPHPTGHSPGTPP